MKCRVLEPHVQHALVLFPQSGYCANRMVAVLSLAGYSTASPSAVTEPVLAESCWSDKIQIIRDFLLDKLPSYMIPDIWIFLEQIPRNSSSKLDRKKVNNFVQEITRDFYDKMILRMEGEDAEERPGNETEIVLKDIWCKVLNISESEIRWNTSFFYLGMQ